jgi:hypothetical protein
MEEVMSKKTAKKIGSDPILCLCATGSYVQYGKQGLTLFFLVQIQEAVFANYQRQHIVTTVVRTIFGVRTSCELANYHAGLVGRNTT